MNALPFLFFFSLIHGILTRSSPPPLGEFVRQIVGCWTCLYLAPSLRFSFFLHQSIIGEEETCTGSPFFLFFPPEPGFLWATQRVRKNGCSNRGLRFTGCPFPFFFKEPRPKPGRAPSFFPFFESAGGARLRKMRRMMPMRACLFFFLDATTGRPLFSFFQRPTTPLLGRVKGQVFFRHGR